MLNQSYDCGNESKIYSYLLRSKVNDAVSKKSASAVPCFHISTAGKQIYSKSPALSM